ncbi:MAG: hypothetical protein ACPIOQ_34040, partial [Promethearchaeia archaeon]
MQTLLRMASAPQAQGTPAMVPQVTEEIPPNPDASGHGAGPARALQVVDAPTSDAAAQDKILSAPREREQSLFAMFESLKAEGAVRQTSPEQCSSCGGSSPRERSETPQSLSEAGFAPTPSGSKAYELRLTDSDAALAGEERAPDGVDDGEKHLRHAAAVQKSYHQRSNFNNALVNAAHRKSRQTGGCLQPVGNEVASTVCGAAGAAPRSNTDPDLQVAQALSGNSALSPYRITPYQPGLRNPSASSAGSENAGTMSGIVNGIDVILPSNASSSLSSNRMLSSPRQRTRLKRRTRVMLEGPTCQTTHVSARASAAVEQRCLLHVHPVPPICLLLVLGRDFGSYARTSANMHWSCALGGLFSWFEGASAAAKLALFRS